METKVTFTDSLESIVLEEDAVAVNKNARLAPSTSAEFNYGELRSTFANYCKDYKVRLESNTPSKALEFCSKMLFEVGPNFHKEKKAKGDKMVRFNFCYDKTTDNRRSLDVKTVIVSTFKENTYINNKNVDDDKLILTLTEAGILATDILIDAIKYITPQQYFLTPLCRAIFSTDSIGPMSEQLKMTETEVTVIINASTCSGGQYLDESDMACAIAGALCTTKRMTNDGARKQIITKIIKQYAARKKQYIPERFNIFNEYALGGVPKGMDPDTLIQNFNNIQAGAVNKRIAVLSSRETDCI